jgi:hypothetical protein
VDGKSEACTMRQPLSSLPVADRGAKTWASSLFRSFTSNNLTLIHSLILTLIKIHQIQAYETMRCALFFLVVPSSHPRVFSESIRPTLFASTCAVCAQTSSSRELAPLLSYTCRGSCTNATTSYNSFLDSRIAAIHAIPDSNTIPDHPMRLSFGP